MPCHLHLNVTYLIEADDSDELRIKEDENSAVKWFGVDEAVEANRELEFVCEFNMKLINDIRIITNRMKSKANFKVSYLLSKENAIMKELLKEALMDAKNQATMLASAIDQKVIGLISADKNDPKADDVYLGQVLSMSLCCEQDSDENYDNSDELAATKVTLAEQIYTVWEVE